MYLLRLDDASEYMDECRWKRIEILLERYDIKPIVGVIPDNRDSDLIEKYKFDQCFWIKVKNWQEKGWTIALHGCHHKYTTKYGGIHPVNRFSEFAGVSLDKQKEMISHGISIFNNYEVEPKLFFAPAHTFDLNTLTALKENSNINVVSDTISNDVYFSNGIYFIPQQAGKVRPLHFNIVTFCYHPNNMNDSDFEKLEKFIIKFKCKFGTFEELEFKKKKRNLYDLILNKIYFLFKEIRNQKSAI